MKKILYAGVAIFVVVSLGVYFSSLLEKDGSDFVQAGIGYKNATYIIEGQSVQLVEGVAKTESAPGSASQTVTKFFGNEVAQDLNNDGRDDIVFIVTQETGGSGTFFYVVGALDTEDGFVGTHAVLLGDRIAPQTTEVGPGSSVIVNYADRAPGEPMTTPPSVGKSMRLILDPMTMQFGEVAQNFEGEADPARMSLTMKTWKWQRTEYGDKERETVIPNKDVFTLTFNSNSSFGASTDCNGVGGTYTVTDGMISFSEMMSTLMFCEDSQESEFTTMLADARVYEFTSKGELILNLGSQGGSMYFR